MIVVEDLVAEHQDEEKADEQHAQRPRLRPGKLGPPHDAQPLAVVSEHSSRRREPSKAKPELKERPGKSTCDLT